jgi:hypothetical protein
MDSYCTGCEAKSRYIQLDWGDTKPKVDVFQWGAGERIGGLPVSRAGLAIGCSSAEKCGQLRAERIGEFGCPL